MRKIITVCVAILLALTASYTALAEEFDQDRIGSVSVILTETKQNLPIGKSTRQSQNCEMFYS